MSIEILLDQVLSKWRKSISGRISTCLKKDLLSYFNGTLELIRAMVTSSLGILFDGVGLIEME
jgi:hypothetical protein